jgi:Uma2 family endonuclease
MSPAGTHSPSPRYANAGFFRLTVAQYHDMIRNHTLTPDDKVELLNGYLVNKMPQGTPHSGAIDSLDEDLHRVVPAGWRVRAQLPITLSASEPEPDFAVVRGVRGAFAQRHPNGSDFGIVIEVADSSLHHDRREKGEVYAAAGIPVYWVVNGIDRQVEVYTDPQPAADPPAYATRTDYPHGSSVPVVLDGVAVATLAVADLVP